jgi:hypothetical protein
MFDKPKFAGEIIVARRNAINTYNTKIDDMAVGLGGSLPKYSREEKLKHYCKKLQFVWEGKLCLE